MVGIAGIAGIVEDPSQAANDADLGLNLAKEQHTPIATQGAAIEIGLQIFTAKSCKG
jgi:hypothetical protein